MAGLVAAAGFLMATTAIAFVVACWTAIDFVLIAAAFDIADVATGK